MAKALSDYIAAVRRNLLTEDGAADHWTDAILTPIVNEARQWWQSGIMESFISEWATEVELQTDANGYLTIPDDFVIGHELEKGTIASPQTRQRVTLLDATNWHLAHTGPRYPSAVLNEKWVRIGIYLKPRGTPQGAGVTYVLTYTKQVSDLSSGSPEDNELHARYFNGIAWKATSLASAQAEELRISSVYEGRAQEELNRWQTLAANQHLNEEEGFQDVMGYGYDDDPWPLADL